MKNDKVPWRMVTLLSATATAAYLCRANLSTAAPLLMQEYGLTQTQMGQVFSAFVLGYAFFQVPAGMLADKWGTGRLLGIAAWCWAALTFFQAGIGWGPFQFTAATALGLFVTGRILFGISASPTYPAAGRGIALWVPPGSRALANGLLISSVGIGSALAPPFVSHLMLAWGWRTAIFCSALPAVVIAVIWHFYRRSRSSLNEKEIQSAQGEVSNQKNPLLRSRGFILLTLSYTLEGYVGYIFVTWFYLYLVQERHFGLLTGGWVSALPWILSILSMPLGGLLADKLWKKNGDGWKGGRLVPMCGLAFSGILISIGAHTNSAVIAAISLAFATAFVLCVEGPFWSVMAHFAGEKSGRAGGIMNMGTNLGGLISPALTPWLATKIGWENALHLAAVIAVIAGLLWIWIRIPEKKVSNSSFPVN